MQINIKTSKESQSIITQLTKKLPSGTSENIIARIALGYSLSKGTRFSTDDFGEYDSQGKEYKDHILFDSEYRDFYIALICQAYNINKSNEFIAKYIKMHIDDGLHSMNAYFERNQNLLFFDFLMQYLDRGLEALGNIEAPFEPIINLNQHIKKSAYSGPINIKIGTTLDSNEDIMFCFNNTKLYNNPHIAVAGTSGSGKTQFAFEFMRQIHDKTGNSVNFIFMDFKGMKEEDRRRNEEFFNSAEISFIDAPNTPFPLNPLTFIDNMNEKNKLMGINRFCEIITEHAKIGKVQKQTLKNALVQAFAEKADGAYPSLKDVTNIILEEYQDKRDSLSEIMDSLSEYELFDSSVTSPEDFLNHNYYFSLSGDLNESVRFTSVFLVLHYIYNVFSNMGNAEVNNDYQSIRYILMIDEAHDLFREKKSLTTLENMLRKMRSYGVSIFLLSQGIAEFNAGAFDFSQACETAFLLPNNDLGNVRNINKFLGLAENESQKAMRNIEKLSKGLAMSNVKELDKTEVFNLIQYHKEHVDRGLSQLT